jgi:hypothetical protein
MQGKGVTDDEPDETYWKVVHRVRLTGMPGFRSSLTDSQSWQTSLLLANCGQVAGFRQGAAREFSPDAAVKGRCFADRGNGPKFTLNAISLFIKSNLMCLR